MSKINKEGAEVLRTNPSWFESGYHAKTGETLDRAEFEKRVKAMKYLSKGSTLGNLYKVQGRTPLFKLKLSEGKNYKVHADCLITALLDLISEGQLQTSISEQGNKKLSNSTSTMTGVQIYLLH
jgi:hypothetical protein